MKLAGALAAGSPGLRFGLLYGHSRWAAEIERNRGTDEFLQGRLIDIVAFVDIDSAPRIAVKAGVE